VQNPPVNSKSAVVLWFSNARRMVSIDSLALLPPGWQETQKSSKTSSRLHEATEWSHRSNDILGIRKRAAEERLFEQPARERTGVTV